MIAAAASVYQGGYCYGEARDGERCYSRCLVPVLHNHAFLNIIFDGLNSKSRPLLDHEASVMIRLRFGDEFR
jgi:hypothetical protein